MALALHHDVVGSGPRVVLVHGFTQTSRCWGDLPGRLADEREVVTVDAPGHGRSSAVEADLPRAARLIGEVGQDATYVGYSMGARMVLHLALDRPDLVRRLVLISGTPGIEDPEERRARRAHDEELASRLIRDGVDAFLDEWLQQPMFASLPRDDECLAARRTNTIAGLASSLIRCGTGTQEPLWSRLPELAMPTLIITGADDEKFTTIGRRMAEAIGSNARHEVIEDAGHAAHSERPDLVDKLVTAFVSEN